MFNLRFKDLCVICWPHHFQCNEELSIAEDNGGEGNRKAEAKEEHHIGFVVVFVVCGVPVWTTGALQAFWDIPGGVTQEHWAYVPSAASQL